MNNEQTPHTMETFLEKLARLEGMMQHCLREAKVAPTKALRDKYNKDFYMYSEAIEKLWKKRERLRSLPLIPETMWREGYDYPSDDEEQDDDFFERADHDYEQLNDK